MQNIINGKIIFLTMFRLTTIEIASMVGLDDSDMDPDYKESEEEEDSSEESEAEMTPAEVAAAETSEVQIVMEPPVERPDGDTDRDSGKVFEFFFNFP